ncbi:MAG: hypothetical protein RIC14_05435 [Filomicrobium sp.]
MAVKKSTKTQETIVKEIAYSRGTFCLLGTSPLIFNRFGPTQMRALLYPSGSSRKSKQLKHSPMFEYRDSFNTTDDFPADFCDQKESYVIIPGAAIKSAMREAALEQEALTKAGIGRLTRVLPEAIPVYGIPHVFCRMVRASDSKKTPDVRTRAIMPKWASIVTVEWAEPQLSTSKVTTLLQTAGDVIGIGDWRAEKGKGNYGSFRVVSIDNPDFQSLLKNCGAKQQLAAADKPDFFDNHSARLVRWFDEEVVDRGDSNKVKRWEVENAAQ